MKAKIKLNQNQLEQFSQVFHDILFYKNIAKDAREYLEKRGLNLNNLEKYEIGFCPASAPYPSRESHFAEGRTWMNIGRIVVTIRSEYKGEILGFAGRKMDFCYDEIEKILFNRYRYKTAKNMMEKWNKAKWINDIYEKKFHLYRLWENKRNIAKTQCAIITEGYMDAISLSMHGFNNVVALCGTSMTPYHTFLLKGLNVKKVIVCLDNDEGGNNSYEKGLSSDKKTWNRFKNWSKITLPKKIDPDEAINSEKYRDKLKSALSIAMIDNKPGRNIDITSKKFINAFNKNIRGV